MANFFRNKGRGSHQLNLSGNTSYYIADVNELNGLVIGTDLVAGALVFDPRTGKIWALTTGTITSGSGLITAGATDETPAGVPDGTVTNSILRWNGSAWVEESDLTVDASGNVATSGTIISTNSTASTNKDTGAIVTEGGIGAEGNINAGGNLAAVGSVTGGTGVTATTGGLTATAGGLTVTAGTTDINDVTNISGAVTLDNAAANSLAMSGTTNVIDLNGTAAQSIEMAGTTNLIDLAGTGAHEIQMGGTTNTIDLNGTGAQAIEMAGTTNTINLGGSGNAEISFTASGTKKISGLDTPSSANDAANKAYVDAVASGLSVKSPARVATTAALPGSPTYDNGTGGVGATLTSTGGGTSLNTAGIDGVANLAVNDEILVKNQSNQAHNGKYIVTTVGVDSSVEYVLTRVTPYDEASEITDGSFFFVKEGTTNGDRGFVQTQAVTTIGTDDIIFQQFSSAGGGVTNVSTESGSATPSGGLITITGSPSIDTSATGSTVTVALAADLTSGATGFTVGSGRVPFASAADTLSANAHFTFDNTYKVIGVGDTSSAPTNSAIIFNSSSGSGVSTHGILEPINGVLLATDTDSPDLGVTTGATSGTGISGDLTVKSGATSGSGDSGAATFGSGNSGSGATGSVTLATGTTSGTRGSVTIQGNTINLDGLASNQVVLTSNATDQETSSANGAVASVGYVRTDVVQREINASVANAGTQALTVDADAVKFYVKVKGNTTEADAYASEIMAVVNSGSTVDATEYSMVGNAALASIAIARVSATSISCTVTNNTGETATIAIHAIPIR